MQIAELAVVHLARTFVDLQGEAQMAPAMSVKVHSTNPTTMSR